MFDGIEILKTTNMLQATASKPKAKKTRKAPKLIITDNVPSGKTNVSAKALESMSGEGAVMSYDQAVSKGYFGNGNEKEAVEATPAPTPTPVTVDLVEEVKQIPEEALEDLAHAILAERAAGFDLCIVDQAGNTITGMRIVRTPTKKLTVM